MLEEFNLLAFYLSFFSVHIGACVNVCVCVCVHACACTHMPAGTYMSVCLCLCLCGRVPLEAKRAEIIGGYEQSDVSTGTKL